MRQKLFIFLAMIFLAALLVGLNAVSYVQKETKPDSEFYPNRSTYHAGATGTRAFYDLLAETGRRPVRWQEKPAALLADSADKPQTFVVIGNLRRDFEDNEVEQLLRWVSLGGKLVVIDRAPRKDLISTTANWQISAVPTVNSSFEIDPTNQPQMTAKTNAAKSLLPTVYTQNVNAVQPSQLASSIKLESFAADETTKINGVAPTASPRYEDEYDEEDEPPAPKSTPKPTGNGRGSGAGNGSAKDAEQDSTKTPPPIIIAKPTPAPRKNGNGVGQGSGVGSGDGRKDNEVTTVLKTPLPATVTTETPEPQIKSIALNAPVVHVADRDKTLLTDFPYGSGQIVFLSDPYIVSNAGISLVDNAQLAINIVASPNGTIAFDEYHQGFGTNENRLLAYFAGTPIPAIFAQLLLLVAVVLFTQSRRFARPLPAVEPNRLSKLEYVSAMAELQGRAKAYDLAIENIYTEFRRRAAKFLGVDNYAASRKDLAGLIAERTDSKPDDIENLMRKCENIIQGEPTNKREVLELTARLREIEEKLGLKRTRKQTFRK